MNIEKSLSDKMFFSISLKDTKNVIGYYRQFIDYHEKHGDQEDLDLLGFVNEKYSEYMIQMNVITQLKGDREK